MTPFANADEFKVVRPVEFRKPEGFSSPEQTLYKLRRQFEFDLEGVIVSTGLQHTSLRHVQPEVGPRWELHDLWDDQSDPLRNGVRAIEPEPPDLGGAGAG